MLKTSITKFFRTVALIYIAAAGFPCSRVEKCEMTTKIHIKYANGIKSWGPYSFELPLKSTRESRLSTD